MLMNVNFRICRDELYTKKLKKYGKNQKSIFPTFLGSAVLASSVALLKKKKKQL
jgi:LPXTG-motif cell wall-anchored protein